jgi:hypothetical protein
MRQLYTLWMELRRAPDRWISIGGSAPQTYSEGGGLPGGSDVVTIPFEIVLCGLASCISSTGCLLHRGRHQTISSYRFGAMDVNKPYSLKGLGLWILHRKYWGGRLPDPPLFSGGREAPQNEAGGGQWGGSSPECMYLCKALISAFVVVRSALVSFTLGFCLLICTAAEAS